MDSKKKPLLGRLPILILEEPTNSLNPYDILNHGRLLFKGNSGDLRCSARQRRMSADNLEDLLLFMVEQDTATRKQRVKL